ncbi:glycosyltransferase family protein [Brevibacillus choshinensis]|uniref:glycosyltransferase family protein n=1 Tax=Brevibacillus choshinensis TaxID=54911 RepID=UPI002E1DF269|nr:glycosyltransferase family protein [Brevibacillus choshinensis]MED4753933.1 glycosyltransferase family protein [Brevibacillus choshinensis]MED4779064.1 glycosyltransferase family protein [Brevibacillus choshinensis]
MKVIVIIQARMGSSRLPGKVLLPLGATIVLDYVVSRCKQIGDATDVIIATSTSDRDNPIMEWCEKHQVSCFRGSEEDVLSRFYECAAVYQPDYVIRVTSDCPFIDYHMMNQIVKQVEGQPADIVFVEGHLPRGLEAEIVSFSALETMNNVASEEKYREHVTYYAYEYKDTFRTATYQAPVSLCHPELRITLDTMEDYLLCRAVADHFIEDRLVPSQSIVDYLSNHPELAQINAHVKQKEI